MNNIKKEPILYPELKMKVYHESIYGGKELMTIVGIRETEVELQGDFSGGTHNVIQKSWFPIHGLFKLRKICPEHQKPEGCQLNNIQCSYPDCEPYVELEEPKDELLFLNEFKRKTPEEVLKPYVEQVFRHSRVVSEENALKAIQEYNDQFFDDNKEIRKKLAESICDFLRIKFNTYIWKIHIVNDDSYYICCDNWEFLKSETFLKFHTEKLLNKLFEFKIYPIPIVHSSEIILNK